MHKNIFHIVLGFTVSISLQNIYCADSPAQTKTDAELFAKDPQGYAERHALQPLFPEDATKQYYLNPFGSIVLHTQAGNSCAAKIQQTPISAETLATLTIQNLKDLASKQVQKWQKSSPGLAFLEQEQGSQEKMVYFLNANTDKSIYCTPITTQKTTEIQSFYSAFLQDHAGTSNHFNVIATYAKHISKYQILFLHSKRGDDRIQALECKTLQGLKNGYIYFLAGIFGTYQQFKISPTNYEITVKNKQDMDTFMKDIAQGLTEEDNKAVKNCRGVYTMGQHNPF